LIAFPFFVVSSPSQSQERPNELQNKDIVHMINAKMPPEAIIAKIKDFTCSFNTAPSALIELASQGVPTEVLVAMIQANPPVMPKADMTVFGIPLGQPFAVPECRKEKFLKSVTYLPTRTNYFKVDLALDSGKINGQAILVLRSIAFQIKNCGDYVFSVGRHVIQRGFGAVSSILLCCIPGGTEFWIFSSPGINHAAIDVRQLSGTSHNAARRRVGKSRPRRCPYSLS
jgi:hypothetical protein